MKFSIKKVLLSLAIAGLTVGTVQAKTDIKEIRNEAAIMLNILQASLKQQRSDKNIRFRTNAVMYLAGQGVVFDIDSSGGRSFFGFDLGEMLSGITALPQPVKPAQPAKPVKLNGGRFEINIDEHEIEAIVRDVMEHGDDYKHEIRDKMRELSEQQRELAWEEREYSRAKRDLDFEKRSADGERRKEIDERIAEMANELKKLESKSLELDKYKKELDDEHQEQIAKRDAVKRKLYNQSLALFEDTIGDVLCRYGAGIRALPENENITFVIQNFIEADSDSALNTHDKVYVFKHKDVKDCVSGKTNKNKLLAAVNTYLF